MPGKSAIGSILVSVVLAMSGAGIVIAQDSTTPEPLVTTREVPNAFGTSAYTVTTITATAFTPANDGMLFGTTGSLGRNGAINVLSEFYTALDLPAGAVIDYIGLNSFTDTAFAYGVELIRRDKFGSLATIGTFSSSVHGWDTDFNLSPIGYPWYGKSGDALIIKVEEAAVPTAQYFGWVEVWWRRTVSPAPGSPTFNDVPLNHPFFQYIEALAAAGITGGCGNGNFCPNNSITRGQMAVFLAKALGLHWPGN